MEYIWEPSRSTPVTAECDIAIAGGGVAGIAAALSAARSGAKRVLLVEREFALGGLATLGLVTIYLPLCDGCGRQVTFGISEELLRLSIRHGCEGRYPDAWLGDAPTERRRTQRFEAQFNPSLFALLTERLLLDEGVEVLYGTSICGVSMGGNGIEALIAENKSGRFAIRVGAVVDATGDADVCALSGAPTAVYQRGNVLAAWYYRQKEHEVKLKMLGYAEAPQGGVSVGGSAPLVPTRYTGIDGRELSRMAQDSHRQVLSDFLKEGELGPGHTLTSIAAIPQIRMSRKLVGAYTLGEEEVHTRFDDSIGIIGDWRKLGPMYELPVRTLYSAAVPNLIAAGRCISVTDAMWDITRVIPACAATGEAAGTAAALTNDFRRLDVLLLQRQLKSRHGRLHIDETDA
ncbi:MAG TPA: FAD-dependent oxidoreductase [Clostridia bacterium]|nr:FAD-dependent oxidoreductase [Clostridia bacterium]